MENDGTLYHCETTKSTMFESERPKAYRNQPTHTMVISQIRMSSPWYQGSDSQSYVLDSESSMGVGRVVQLPVVLVRES